MRVTLEPWRTRERTPRRANGSGTITYDAKRQRYDVRVTIDDRRRKVSAATQAEAWRRAKELKAGATVPGLPARPTVGEWLDHWATQVVPGTVKQTTLDSYVWLCDKYLKPVLGRHRLSDLTPAHVREMRRQMESGLPGRVATLAGTTMNICGHLVSGEKKAAAAVRAGVLTGGRTEASGS